MHCFKAVLMLLHELNKRCTAVKFVSRLLSHVQKEHPVAVYSELKEHTKNDPNFISIITDDESLVYGCDPETKQQLYHCSSLKHDKFETMSTQC
jgi:hypothetical protein